MEIWAISSLVLGEPFSQFNQLTEAHGLPSSSIRIIMQDDEGVIWVGIESNGICRYDGHGFELYNESSKGNRRLSGNNAKKIVDDGKGNLWIATTDGLNRLHKKSDSITIFKHDPSGNRIRDIEIDSRGHLWLGTYDGIRVFDPSTEQFELLSLSESDEGITYITDLYTDGDGWIWVMAHSGLYVFDPETKKGRKLSQQRLEGGDSIGRFFCATSDHDGHMWFGTDVGVLLMEKGSDTLHRFDWIDEDGNEFGLETAYAAMTDSQGNVWLGMARDGLRIIDPMNKKVFTRKAELGVRNALYAKFILALFEDRDGRVWIGSKHNGLHIYDPLSEILGKRRFRSRSDPMKYAHIVAMDIDSRGIVWLGTLDSGVIRFNPKTDETRYYSPEELSKGDQSSEMVMGVLVDGDDDVFVASGHGFSVIRDDGMLIESKKLGVHCQGFVSTKNGGVYMASSGGVFEIDKNSMSGVLLSSKDGLEKMAPFDDMRARAIFEDSEENIWIASNTEFVYRYRPSEDNIEQFESLLSEPLDESVISGRAFYEQDGDYLWIASKKSGLVRYSYKTNTALHYETQDGLPSSSVYGILGTKNGELWLSGDRGLTHFAPKTETFTNYNRLYGIQGQNFEANAQCIDEDGILYFGGENGLNRFDPSLVKKAEAKGDLIFSTISVGSTVIARNEKIVAPIELDYDQNQIIFDFALLDYSYLGQNEYSYRMSGIDAGWINSGRRHIAPYNSLSSGSYTFTVRGKSPEETWGAHSREVSFSFYVSPPFWETLSFRVALSLVILGLLVGLFVWILVRGRRTKKHLEAIVNLRTLDLKLANEKLLEQKEILVERSEEIDSQNRELESSRDGLELLVQERTKELAAAKDKAEESDRLKTAFLANMSHEIRTPLNAIMGFSQILLMEEDLEKDHRGYLDAITNSATLLLSLISDMLDLAVIESGRQVVKASRIELAEFFSDQSFEFEQMIRTTKEGVEYQESIDLGEEVKLLKSDPVRIKQILNNFFSNACKFTDVGHIKFGVKVSDGELVCTVSDTGRGIAEDDLINVFDRFYKVMDSTKPFVQGTGLGLSVSMNLAELLGGKVWATSREDEGSCFFLSIPLKGTALSKDFDI